MFIATDRLSLKRINMNILKNNKGFPREAYVLKQFKSLRFKVSKSNLGTRSILAMISVKRGSPMLVHILRMLPVLGVRVSSNWVRIVRFFLKEIKKMHNNGGAPQVVKYLKACSVLLQQSISGYIISDPGALGIRVSRTISGLPKIIPSVHRKMIRKGDQKIIRFWLTVFSLYRDIDFDGTLKLSTITAPSKGDLNYRVNRFIPQFRALIAPVPSDLGQGKVRSTLFQMFTSGPQASREAKITNTNPVSVYRAFWLLMKPENKHLKDALFFFSKYFHHQEFEQLWELCIRGPKGNTWRERISPTPREWDMAIPKSKYLGRLATKNEAAGKVRVFAMVDPWTQWALKPLHGILFNLLKKIPMDGTFDQLRPLDRVPFNRGPIYSFDLSAATDRLPISLQTDILSSFFGEEFSLHWKNLLVGRPYRCPSPTELEGVTNRWSVPKDVTYAVGQPMGALSSWAMLAVTHHYLVQYCAWSKGVVSSRVWFEDYAVLGDDIVIWNRTVAKMYLRVLTRLGVEVGLAKSIVSPKGVGLEFAKRTIFQKEDVSPVPFREQKAAHKSLSAVINFADKYKLLPNAVLRFLGYGYQVDFNKKNSAVQTMKLGASIPQTSQEVMWMFHPISLKGRWTESVSKKRLAAAKAIEADALRISKGRRPLNKTQIRREVTGVDKEFPIAMRGQEMFRLILSELTTLKLQLSQLRGDTLGFRTELNIGTRFHSWVNQTGWSDLDAEFASKMRAIILNGELTRLLEQVDRFQIIVRILNEELLPVISQILGNEQIAIEAVHSVFTMPSMMIKYSGPNFHRHFLGLNGIPRRGPVWIGTEECGPLNVDYYVLQAFNDLFTIRSTLQTIDLKRVKQGLPSGPTSQAFEESRAALKLWTLWSTRFAKIKKNMILQSKQTLITSPS